MKRLIVLLLLVSVGLNVGLLLKTRDAGGPPAVREGRWRQERALRPAFDDTSGWREVIARRLDRMADRLDLTPEQREAFAAAQEAAGRQMRERRRLLSTAQQRLRELTADGSVSTEALRDAMLDLRARQTAMDSLAGEFMLRELEILEPHQRALYLELLPLEHGPGRGREPWSPRGRRGGRQGNNPG
jgi:Spy/CpxP family protein refolding chaperone